MRRVSILQPWLPQYRLPFFEQLRDRLAANDIELTVAHGDPPGYLKARGDSRSASWAVHLKGGRILRSPFELHDVRAVTRGRDLIIVEQAIRNLDSYCMLAPRAFRDVPTAMWGHGRTYVKQQSTPGLWLKDRLTLSSSWFFAYTDGGAAYVRSIGYPPERITTVQNSIDTSALAREVQSVSAEEVSSFRASLGIPGQRQALYLGALDSDKRIPLLLAVAKAAAASIPDFHLTIVGDGAEAPMVRDAAARSDWLTYGGALHGRDKAVALKASALLINPGRVGLVAVDSFAAGVPLVATDWQWHAPEFEYLVNGSNAFITEDAVGALSAGVARVWTDDALRTRLIQGCSEAANVYTLEAMVCRFATGVQAAVENVR